MKFTGLIILSLFLFSYTYSSNSINYLEPCPHAKLVSINNNIIIGFEKPVLLNEEEIQKNVSVTGSVSKNHNLNIILCEDGKKILFNPLTPFIHGEKITVSLTGNLIKSIGRKEYVYSFYTAGSKINWEPIKSIRDELKINTEPFINDFLPPAFPTLTVTIDNNPAPGFIFLSNYRYLSYQAYLIITNNHGIPHWYSQMGSNCDDFKKQPNGNLTYYFLASRAYIELNVNYAPIHIYHCGNGYTTDVHELRVLNSGNAYLMAYDPEIVDMSQIVPGGDTNATVVGLIIQEVDYNNNVIFQWKSWDHFAITDAWHENMDSSYIDCVHGNAIEIDNDSNIILSSRHLDEITKINRTTGSIMWRWGGKHNQFTFLGSDTLKFTYQHAIRKIANGNLILFDNGNFHTPHFSRAVEYSMNVSNNTVTEVWEYRHTPTIFGFAMGNAQRLPNGNTFICWGYTNPNITEVTANGTIVFEMTLPTGDITYRATKDDWNGNPVAIKNDNTPVPSLFKLNQNYPNPFNPSTRITYEIAKSSNVKLTIFDVLGREVAVLLNTKQQPGTYEVVWDAVNFPSGVYFYKIQTDYYASTRKMTLLK